MLLGQQVLKIGSHLQGEELVSEKQGDERAEEQDTPAIPVNKISNPFHILSITLEWDARLIIILLQRIKVKLA
jgi:hypothetical protein